MSGILEEHLASLSPEKYEMLVGTGHEDALRYGFSRKRAVHPGVNGQIIPPPMIPHAWGHLMETLPDPKRKRMAYIHIPFCSHICLYCGFFQNYLDEEKENKYVERLLKEMDMAKNDRLVQAKPFQCVFFGGGTPSSLSPENSARVLQKLHECLPLTNDCEITMEARICDLVPERMEAWFANGVNRVSIGVQSFDTKVRQDSGRLDNRETVLERLRKIASYDQAAIIVDIIFGLPGQSLDSFMNDLATIDSLPISGMDLYQLNLFHGSPMEKAIQNGKLPPAATKAEQAVMFAAAEKWLGDRAYKRLSNCHWSKDIRERSMYNIMAKTGAEVMPFGCGAGGFMGDYSLMQMRDLQKYMDMIDAGKKPIMVMSGKSHFDDAHKAISQNMEQGYLDFNRLTAAYGDLAQLTLLLDKWCANGLMTKGDAMYFQTQAGRFWQNNLTQSLLDCTEYILSKGMAEDVQPMQGMSGMPPGHPGMQGMPAGHPGMKGMPPGHPGMDGMPQGHPSMAGHPGMEHPHKMTS